MKRTYLSILLFSLVLLLPAHAAAGSHYLPVDGVTVHYKTMGKGSDTLFFIHGFSCDTSVWRHQYPAFRDHRIISIDLPGHGMSGSPRIDYTQQRFADAIKAVMDAEKTDKALLVVHSMGYQIARTFVDSYPNRISGLCIVDGAYFRVPPNKTREEYQNFLNGLVTIASTNESMDGFLESMRQYTSSEAVSREYTTLMLSTPVHVRISAMRDFCDLDNWSEHSQSVSTQVIFAAIPELASDNEQYMRTQFSNLEYHQWNNVGHFLMMERPDEFNALLGAFFKRVNGE